MHFFRETQSSFAGASLCGVISVLVRQPGRSSCIPYTLWFCARWLLGLCPRPAGQPSAVVSASLRLLALIAMDGMYAGVAGAIKPAMKKLLFLKLPPRLVVF